MLTGEGYLAPLRAIPRLIEELHAGGVAGIVRPACPGCHRVVRIDKPLGGVRVCRTCIAHSRSQQCARCGTRREPVARDDNGGPLCANCFITAPANLETCIGCGRRRRVERRTLDGPLCSRCPSLPLLTCSICGQTAPCGISRITGQPWCPACQRRSAACSACGRLAAIASGTLTDPLCDGCTGAPAWAGCRVCSDPGHPSPGQCARCLINRRLDKLMGGPGHALPPGLQALRREIAAATAAAASFDRATTQSLLATARGIADGIGEANHMGTAFGPVNVAIHAIAASLKLGDPRTATETGEALDLAAMPAGLVGRRTQVNLDLARAYAMTRKDAAAVNLLLAAERLSPQLVRYDPATRDVLTELLRREHRPSTPELRPLARRAGVI